MRIHKARNIARHIEQGRSETSKDEICSAFHALDRQRIRPSVPKEQRREDYRLAKIIWDHVGTW